MMKKGKLQQMLSKKKPILMIGVSLFEPAVMEMAALAGFDAAVLDAIQLIRSPEAICHMIRAADIYGLSVIVRTDEAHAQAYLDFGAEGVMFERVETAEQAKELVSICRYPPYGTRGMHARSRKGNYGQDTMEERHVEQGGDEIIILQIESQKGMENAEEILKVPGICLISCGRNDLALSMGIPGQTRHTKVRQSEQRLCRMVREAGLPPVLMVADNEKEAKELLAEGNYVLSAGHDEEILLSALRAKAREIRSALESDYEKK